MGRKTGPSTIRRASPSAPVEPRAVQTLVPPSVVNIPQLAAMLGMSDRHLYRQAATGEIAVQYGRAWHVVPVVRIGCRYVVPVHALAFLSGEAA